MTAANVIDIHKYLKNQNNNKILNGTAINIYLSFWM